jgi:DNA-binding NtrC family response regulator
MNIIIIDNNEEFVSKLESSLNVNIKHFSNPFEALIFLKRESFDFIILNILNKNISGIKLLQQIKKLNLKSKIIVMSSLIEDNIRRICMINGCNIFIERTEHGLDKLKKIIRSNFTDIIH